MAKSMDAERHEARAWVSPEDLNVAPALLGLPLATPRRRLYAMGVDLIAIAIFSQLANLWMLAAIALPLAERARSGRVGPSRRRRVAAWALAVPLALAGLYEAANDKSPLDGLDEDETAVTAPAASSASGAASGPASAPSHAVTLQGRQVAALVASTLAHAAASAASAAEVATAGASAPVPMSAESAAAVGATLEQQIEQVADQVATQAQAKAEAKRARKAAARASGSIDDKTADDASADDAEHAPKTLREKIAHSLDELGLGYGWSIVYFTLLPAWWRGQTLGKRLFGLRVLELTGKPMTAMRNLKRYGGYAAGLATGGLGLVQLLWDSNRQSIQDKTAHTVVVDERRPRRPMPMPTPMPTTTDAVPTAAAPTALPAGAPAPAIAVATPPSLEAPGMPAATSPAQPPTSAG